MNSGDELLIRYTDINLPIRAREDVYGPVPLHWHSYYEVELITDGEPLHLINGSIRTMKPGMISIMTPRDFHQYSGKSRIKIFIFKEYDIVFFIDFFVSDTLPDSIRINLARTALINSFIEKERMSAF